MNQYLYMLDKVLTEGTERDDRTNTGTIDLFGPQMVFDLQKGFPLLTTKKINLRNVLGELIWILRGSTNNNELRDITYGKKSHKKTIWEQWAHPDTGELGPVYGHQLRNWYGDIQETDEVDQLKLLIHNLKENPYSRRHVVSLWNAFDLPIEGFDHKMNIENGFAVLPPCHCLFQFHVHEGVKKYYDQNRELPYRTEKVKYLSCKLYQRSADMFIGVPYNIASYATLTCLIAHQLGMEPYKFIHTFGSAHIYKNHIKQVKLQMSREPRELPKLEIKTKRENIWEYEVDDFNLSGYNPHGFISAPVAV